jgi:AhpC/TSA antioxidant enzyme
MTSFVPFRSLSNRFSLIATASVMTVAALSTAITAQQCLIPEKLQLSKTLESFELKDAEMIPLSMKDNTVTEVESIRANEMIQRHIGASGAIAYVIRRPGCVFCREEGVELMKLAENPVLEGFNFLGIVKETGVDDEGLLEFGKSYPYPIYRDVDLKFYQALGNRKLSLETWNPLRIVKGMLWLRDAVKRTESKNLEGNLKGEGFLKGGVIIFGKDGTQKYAYAEETFEEFPSSDILAAIDVLKKNES